MKPDGGIKSEDDRDGRRGRDFNFHGSAEFGSCQLEK